MKKFLYNITQYNKKAILLLLLICISISVQGRNLHQPDSLQAIQSSTTKNGNFFKKIVKFVNKQLEQDSFYVQPNKYNMTIMPQYTYGYEYYRFATENKEQSITITPAANNKIGVFLKWRVFSFGYKFTLNNIQPEFDMEFNLYCSRVRLELFYRKRNDGFKIRNIKGFYENGKALTEYNRDFNGLTTSQIGANLFYIFNYKKFSFPAAYSQSSIQRRNAGSFILGLNYNEHFFIFDHTKVDPKIESLMSPELKFNKINYIDLSVNFGYSYNWVFAKNFLANISSTPAIGYKTTSLKSIIDNSTEYESSINIDLVTRMAVVYNNGKYYAGASFTSHTYTYTKPTISILNGFGYLKIYAGFYFWRKK